MAATLLRRRPKTRRVRPRPPPGVSSTTVPRSVLRGSARRALDVRVAAGTQLDPARLRLLRLRHPNLEHAVDVRGGDLRFVASGRQAHRAREAAVTPFEPEEAVALLLRLLHALARNGERVVLNLDLDLVLGKTGQIERVDELGLGLPDIERGRPPLRRPTLAFEQAVEETTHLPLELGDLTERLPAHERWHSYVPPVLRLNRS